MHACMTEDLLDELKPSIATVETDMRDAKRRITLARGPVRPAKPAAEAEEDHCESDSMYIAAENEDGSGEESDK